MSGNPADILKEYLVSLGFETDSASYNKFRQTIADISKEIDNHIPAWAKEYTAAAATIVTALSGIAAATAGLVDHIAQADLGYQKFALHMFMGAQQAREMKVATDALGESLEDIAWMPELRQRYFKLLGIENTMEGAAPGDSESVLRQVRDTRFEFTKLRVEATYVMRDVAVLLAKHYNIGNIQKWLSGLNKWIETHGVQVAEKIAHVLEMFIQIGQDVVRFVGDIIRPIKELWGHLDKTGKSFLTLGGIIAQFFAVGAIPIIGPMIQAMEIISGLLLLLDDFYAYIDGRKSSQTLAPIWAEMIEEGQLLKGIFTDLISLLRGLGSSFDDSGKHVNQWRLLIWNLGADVVRITWVVDSLVKALLAGKQAVTGHFKEAWSTLEGIGQDYFNADQTLNQTNPRNIAAVESGGNYGAVNPMTGAAGKYQIMPQNWTVWAIQAGLGVGAPMTPANQDIVAKYKMAQYSKEFGGDQRLVAAAWYAGEGYAKSLQAGHPLYSPDMPQKGGYPSVNEYIQKVTGQAWAANGGAGGGDTHIDNSVGNITVTVKDLNATADAVAKAVHEKIVQEQGKKTAMQLRALQGVGG